VSEGSCHEAVPEASLWQCQEPGTSMFARSTTAVSSLFWYHLWGFTAACKDAIVPVELPVRTGPGRVPTGSCFCSCRGAGSCSTQASHGLFRFTGKKRRFPHQGLNPGSLLVQRPSRSSPGWLAGWTSSQYPSFRQWQMFPLIKTFRKQNNKWELVATSGTGMQQTKDQQEKRN